MKPEQLEEIYTELCNRLTSIGDDRISDGLARVTLLLMNEIGDPSRLSDLFDDALFIKLLIFSFLKPLPLSNNEIDSKIFVFPDPFIP